MQTIMNGGIEEFELPPGSILCATALSGSAYAVITSPQDKFSSAYAQGSTEKSNGKAFVGPFLITTKLAVEAKGRVNVTIFPAGAIYQDAAGDLVISGASVLPAAELATLRRAASPFGTVAASTSVGQTLKAGPGYLKSLTVLAKGTNPTLNLYDNTTASGNQLIPALNGTTAVGAFPAINVGATYVWDQPLYFANGLHIVIGGTAVTTFQFQVR